ncbi:hypothetical protein F0562_034296 [Nyssa sinensis]|uniref:Secreted protein n=1 Tax=Nyssa sinensis TaxID=561372 RepID=A0A5J5AH90_9ASTE|nr:hypothetical protein F0562_034296 [Nyssa sinensis]
MLMKKGMSGLWVFVLVKLLIDNWLYGQQERKNEWLSSDHAVGPHEKCHLSKDIFHLSLHSTILKEAEGRSSLITRILAIQMRKKGCCC